MEKDQIVEEPPTEGRRCPACHNQLDEAGLCSRCGANCRYLIDLEAELDGWQHRAVLAIAESRWLDAERALARAQELETNDFNQTLWGWLQQLKELSLEDQDEAEPTEQQADSAKKSSRLDSVKQFFSRLTGKSGS